MATDKPRFSVTLDDNLNQKVLTYQQKLHVSKSKAATDLILRGIRSLGLDDDDTYAALQKKASSLTDKALQLAFDFEALDQWGQTALLDLARTELARVKAPDTLHFTMAASNGDPTIRNLELPEADQSGDLPEVSSDIPT